MMGRKPKYTVETILKELRSIERMNTDKDFGTFDEKTFAQDVLIFLRRLEKGKRGINE